MAERLQSVRAVVRDEDVAVVDPVQRRHGPSRSETLSSVIDWTALAAVATAISAVVVAFQTFYTRKAAEQTREAADQTARAVEVAVRSAEGTEAALVEAAKGRLDARAPLVRVLLDEPDSHPLQPSAAGGRSQPYPPTTTFRLPRDRETPLAFRVGGRVRNSGQDRTTVQLNTPIAVVGDSPKARPVRSATMVELDPGAEVSFELEDSRPVADWVEGSPAPVIAGDVVCSDAYDDGVVDRWTIELRCHPIAPIPGEDGGWQLRNNMAGMPPVDRPDAVVRHERLYYTSKRADRLLTQTGHELPALERGRAGEHSGPTG